MLIHAATLIIGYKIETDDEVRPDTGGADQSLNGTSVDLICQEQQLHKRTGLINSNTDATHEVLMTKAVMQGNNV